MKYDSGCKKKKMFLNDCPNSKISFYIQQQDHMYKSQYTQVALWAHVPSAHHFPVSLGFYLRGSFSSAQSDM